MYILPTDPRTKRVMFTASLKDEEKKWVPVRDFIFNKDVLTNNRLGKM